MSKSQWKTSIFKELKFFMKHMFPMPDELNWSEDIFEDRKAVSAEFLSMMFEDLKNKEKGKAVPNMRGADKMFMSDAGRIMDAV